MAKVKHIAPTPPRLQPRQAALVLGLLALLVFVVYAPSLKGPFLWDDEHLVVNNSYLRSWTNVPRILATDIGNGAGRQYNFWRPAQIMSYFFDFRIWMLNPLGFHLGNILLHFLCSGALFWFLWTVFADRRLATFAALFFAVHPAHSEAISFISGRADPLLLLFFLLSFVFLLKDTGRPRPLFLFLCLGAYALALLSRESALLLPALVVVTRLTLKRPVSQRAFWGLVVMSVLYVLLRLTALRSVWPAEPLSHFSLAQRLPGAFAAFAGYLRVLLVPVGLHMEYGNRLFAWTDARVIAGIVAFGCWLAALCHKKTSVAVRFGLAWYFFALLPFLNVLSPLNAYMAEHWLYLPSIGLFAALGWGVGRRYERAPLSSGVAAGLVILLWGASSFYHNRFWADPVKFFERTVAFAPESTRARVSLAQAYLAEGRLKEAEALLIEALKIDPREYVAYNTLGLVYYRMNRKNDAEAAWRNGLSVESRFGEFYSNLGVIEAEKGDLDEALFFFKEAIKRNPMNPDAYKNAAVACANAGRYSEALAFWDKVRQLGMRVQDDPGLVEMMEKVRRQVVATDI